MKNKTWKKLNNLLHILVVVSLLLQPVGTPGLLMAMAEDAASAVAVESAPPPEVEPVEEAVAKPEPAPEKEIPKPVVEEVAAEIEKVEAIGVPEAKVVEAVTVEAPTAVEAVIADASAIDATVETEAGNTEAAGTAVEQTEEQAETGVEVAEDTAKPTETMGTITPEAAATEIADDGNVVVDTEAVVETAIVPESGTEVVADPTMAVDEKICLAENAEVKASEFSDWEVNGDVAKTKAAVQLGMQYIFPLDEKVSITFSCLPTDIEKLSTLKIERLKTADLALPDGISAATEYAYDITTEMKNGDFEYDLILPNRASEDTVVSYIEKSIDTAKNNLLKADVKVVAQEKVETDAGQIEASGLDHFTIYVVTYASAIHAIGTEKDSYAQGEVVYAQATGLNKNKFYRLAINPPGYGDSFFVTECVTDVTEVAGEYNLLADAEVKDNWYFDLHEFGNEADCQKDLTSKTIKKQAKFAVVAAVQVQTPLIITASVPTSGCTVDTSGANDEPGQKDLTQMCADYDDLPTSVDISWNWDQTGWSGNNTGDGCSLFDTDGDGLVNYSLCVVVKKNPAVYDSKVLYSCGDDAANKCTSPIAVLAPGAGTVCSASVRGEDPFAAGDSYPQDTVAKCTIALADVGGAAAQLVDVCSYPSQQPNSDPSDCIVFKTKAGKLQVNKVLVPATDAGKFNLQIDGGTLAANVGDGGSTGEQVVSEGIHTVGETAGTGTSLTNYDSTIVCKDLNGTGATVAQSSNSGPLNVEVTENDDIVCVITNTLQKTTLTVNKIVVPSSDPGLFNLRIDGVVYAANVGDGGTTGAQDVTAGSHNVSETAGTNTVLSNYVVTFGGQCDANGNVAIAAGESKTCTITNTRKTGTVYVRKKVDTNGNGVFGTGDNGANTLGFRWGLDQETPTRNMGTNITGVNTGAHSITENSVTGYHFVGWYTNNNTEGYDCSNPQGTTLPVNITVGCQQTTGITLCNARDTGSLKAQKIVDDQSDLSQWSFSLDGGPFLAADGNGLKDFGQVTTAVTHTLVENGPTGFHFVQVTGENCLDKQNGSADATVSYGGTTICTFSNAVDKASLTIIKDAVPDSEQDFAFTTVGGLIPASFSLDDDGDNADGTSNTQTFTNLLPGLYSVTEMASAGWDLGPIVCSSNLQSLSPINGDTFSRELAPGENVTCTFTNTQRGSVTVTKFSDDNGNGAWDQPDEAVLPDWAMQLTDTQLAATEQVTGQNGQTVFGNVLPGAYALSETQQAGWNLTSIYCDNEQVNGLDASNAHAVAIGSGEPVQCFVGNQLIPPALTIEKFNSQWPVVQVPGAIIDYTIIVRAYESNVNNVEVKDLMPDGFTFISGSSTQGGIIKAYASPGIWGLGDMAAGESVTITYRASIGSNQDLGTYRDLAWAVGNDANQNLVLATNAEATTRPAGNDDTGEVVNTENFVGTQIALAIPTALAVELNEDRKTETETRTRRVLGATLPATGASPIAAMLALIILIVGGKLVWEAKKRGKKNLNSPNEIFMKIFIFTILSSALLALGSNARAAIDPAIRLEKPADKVHSQNLELIFVALDVEDRAMTINCYQQGPGGGGFAIFETVNLAVGGNSGTCNAALAGDGVYDFYVSASAGADSGNSETASTELITGTPGTPLNYDREEHGCNVHFTTANDGVTAEVELYRSTELEFVADASTLASTVAIGPNTNGIITDPGAGCDDYYYAIRAVSAADIGSDFVGDEKTTVRRRTRTRTVTVAAEATGAIPVTGGEGGGIAAPIAEGEVAGAETVAGEEGALGEGGVGEEGQVLGAETEMNEEVSWLDRAWPWALGLIILGLIYYGFIRKDTNNKPRNKNVG